jgi:hypothetical protein
MDGSYLFENFGELEVAWDDADPGLRMRVADLAGETRLAASIRLRELRFAP